MVLLLAIATVAYFRRVRTLAADPRRRVSRARQATFVAAVLVLLLEPLWPIGRWDDVSFTAHMIEHLVIGDLAALLMVLGLTGPLIQPLLRNPVVMAVRPLTEPVPAMALWIGNLFFWHLPFAMEAAIGNDYIHVIQHICFFSFSFAVWMALFGPLPKPTWFGNVAKLAYIVVMRMAGLVLGNFFIFSTKVYYSPYVTADNPFGLSAQADQSTAGAVMMAEGTLITFVVLGFLFFRAASEGEASQRLIEYAGEHGIDLPQERSDRAAAAGTTEALRERISGGSALDNDGDSDLS
jgi:cytochrome c oxidase assembly factor CtaG